MIDPKTGAFYNNQMEENAQCFTLGRTATQHAACFNRLECFTPNANVRDIADRMESDSERSDGTVHTYLERRRASQAHAQPQPRRVSQLPVSRLHSLHSERYHALGVLHAQSTQRPRDDVERNGEFLHMYGVHNYSNYKLYPVNMKMRDPSHNSSLEKTLTHTWSTEAKNHISPHELQVHTDKEKIITDSNGRCLCPVIRGSNPQRRHKSCLFWVKYLTMTTPGTFGSTVGARPTPKYPDTRLPTAKHFVEMQDSVVTPSAKPSSETPHYDGCTGLLHVAGLNDAWTPTLKCNHNSENKMSNYNPAAMDDPLGLTSCGDFHEEECDGVGTGTDVLITLPYRKSDCFKRTTPWYLEFSIAAYLSEAFSDVEAGTDVELMCPPYACVQREHPHPAWCSHEGAMERQWNVETRRRLQDNSSALSSEDGTAFLQTQQRTNYPASAWNPLHPWDAGFLQYRKAGSA